MCLDKKTDFSVIFPNLYIRTSQHEFFKVVHSVTMPILAMHLIDGYR